MKKFEELSLSDEIKKSLTAMNFEDMTQIQEKTIPEILNGTDVIGQSQTGTGKTAAFGIPAVEKVDVLKKDVQILILCPTRELATQIQGVIRQISRFKKGLRSIAIYGGDSIERQIRDLKKGVHIVVGTPGRVMDHMRKGTLKLDNIKMIVLDEADEMLNMGFEEDIQTILKDITYTHQTLLFSATMPKRILELTKKYQNHPLHIKIKSQTLTVENIKQVYYDTKVKMKPELLKRLLKIEQPTSAVIFCNTKKKVDDLIEMLKSDNFVAEALHGDIRQSTRERIMKRFKNGQINILVATDVAARGIDVNNLDMVFNYDLPQEHEYYVHRIGRTGRNGKNGKAISFVVGKEIRELHEIEKYAKTKIKLEKAPSISEVEKIENTELTLRLKEIISKQKLATNSLVNSLIDEGFSFEQIAKGLAYYITQKDEPKQSVNFTANSSGMVKLFLTVGKKDKIKVKDIIGAIASKTSISGNDIGKVILLDNYSFLEIPSEYVEEVISTMNKSQIKGKNVKLEIAEN